MTEQTRPTSQYGYPFISRYQPVAHELEGIDYRICDQCHEPMPQASLLSNWYHDSRCPLYPVNVPMTAKGAAQASDRAQDQIRQALAGKVQVQTATAQTYRSPFSPVELAIVGSVLWAYAHAVAAAETKAIGQVSEATTQIFELSRKAEQAGR